MDAIVKAIEDYIQRVTKRRALDMESVLGDLESLESDLSNLITDVRECIEGRV
tara:strand:+ start:146 stop:304 length:159 start_codon:yes stop_codon:yes gene_type:complete